MPKPVPTLAEFRRQLEVAKAVGLKRFARDWHGASVPEVLEAFRSAVPGSASPGHAAARANALLAAEARPC